MEKLNKQFESNQVLRSSEMNLITSKIDEIIDGLNETNASIYNISHQASNLDLQFDVMPMYAGSDGLYNLTGSEYLEGDEYTNYIDLHSWKLAVTLKINNIKVTQQVLTSTSQIKDVLGPGSTWSASGSIHLIKEVLKWDGTANYGQGAYKMTPCCALTPESTEEQFLLKDCLKFSDIYKYNTSNNGQITNQYYSYNDSGSGKPNIIDAGTYQNYSPRDNTWYAIPQYALEDAITFKSTLTWSKSGGLQNKDYLYISKPLIVEEDNQLDILVAVLRASDYPNVADLWADFKANPTTYINATTLADDTLFHRYYGFLNKNDNWYEGEDHPRNYAEVLAYTGNENDRVTEDDVVVILERSRKGDASRFHETGKSYFISDGIRNFDSSDNQDLDYSREGLDGTIDDWGRMRKVHGFAQLYSDKIGDKYVAAQAIDIPLPAANDWSDRWFTVPPEETYIDFQGNNYYVKGGNNYQCSAFSGWGESDGRQLWIEYA